MLAIPMFAQSAMVGPWSRTQRLVSNPAAARLAKDGTLVASAAALHERPAPAGAHPFDEQEGAVPFYSPA